MFDKVLKNLFNCCLTVTNIRFGWQRCAIMQIEQSVEYKTVRPILQTNYFY
jgi:hypothetical protein